MELEVTIRLYDHPVPSFRGGRVATWTALIDGQEHGEAVPNFYQSTYHPGEADQAVYEIPNGLTDEDLLRSAKARSLAFYFQRKGRLPHPGLPVYHLIVDGVPVPEDSGSAPDFIELDPRVKIRWGLRTNRQPTPDEFKEHLLQNFSDHMLTVLKNKEQEHGDEGYDVIGAPGWGKRWMNFDFLEEKLTEEYGEVLNELSARFGPLLRMWDVQAIRRECVDLANIAMFLWYLAGKE